MTVRMSVRTRPTLENTDTSLKMAGSDSNNAAASKATSLSNTACHFHGAATNPLFLPADYDNLHWLEPVTVVESVRGSKDTRIRRRLRF